MEEREYDGCGKDHTQQALIVLSVYLVDRRNA